ncbi:MAG: hypothetical protein KC964_19910, partial [Candidatus Omnitrophica bacterium]|nr:hypothetical protein [Candidatus Omnitrophota bacterium]
QSRRYLFMPLLVHEEEGPENVELEPEVRPPRGNPPAQAPTPAQVRKRRNQWLHREALWLASRHAQLISEMNVAPDSNRLETLSFQLQKILVEHAKIEEKRKKKDRLQMEDLAPPPSNMEWDELGRFERRDGTGVELVRSKEGFFSLRDEKGETNITQEDMATLFEPLLASQWKPFTLALYFNGQCWWTEAEFLIERTQKAVKRSLSLGVSRPARKEHLEWEVRVHKRFLSDSLDIPQRISDETDSRISQLDQWLDAESPDTLDLLPLCMTLAVSA